MKKNKIKLGIIGFGFVGRAVAHGFLLHADILVYDKYQEGLDPLEKTVNESDFIFVCVPTPADEKGKQDNSTLEEVMGNINRVAATPKIIVLKSTIIVGTTSHFQRLYPRHTVIHEPEFLTERAARLDYINRPRIIIGVSEDRKEDGIRLYEKVLKPRFPHTPIYVTTPEAAELVKYMCNSFFAMKVSFMNEMYDACNHLGIDFPEVKNMFLSDMRIGNSHTDVPGHDGSRGYGGKCFPKDVLALVHWGKENELHFDMLEAADKVNERVREERDWERIKGATTKFGYGQENKESGQEDREPGQEG